MKQAIILDRNDLTLLKGGGSLMLSVSGQQVSLLLDHKPRKRTPRPGKYKCAKCPRSFDSPQGVWMHGRRVHERAVPRQPKKAT